MRGSKIWTDSDENNSKGKFDVSDSLKQSVKIVYLCRMKENKKESAVNFKGLTCRTQRVSLVITALFPGLDSYTAVGLHSAGMSQTFCVSPVRLHAQKGTAMRPNAARLTQASQRCVKASRGSWCRSGV